MFFHTCHTFSITLASTFLSKVSTEEYCIAHTARFDEAAAALLASEQTEDGAAARDGQAIKVRLCVQSIERED